MQITQELVQKLSDENISKKEYDKIVAAIGDKVNDIWRFIINASGRKLDWWAFSNDVSYGHGNGSSGGTFDPQNDAEFIDIGGENSYSESDDYLYNDGFPTRFLWEDYKQEVVKHVEDCKKLKKAAAEKRKEAAAQKKALVESIKKKLTKEELKLVSFKS